MFKDTGAVDAASILFNLDEYKVLSAGVSPVGRTVVIEPISTEAGCPSCGVISSRIQARPVHRVKDVSCGGRDLEVLVRKRRLACLETACERRSFVQTTDQIPLRSRLTTRLVGAIVEAASTEVRSVSGLAVAHGVTWPTVMRKISDIGQMIGNVDYRFVRRLGIDEHRFRRVRFVRNTSGKVQRIEPWSIVFTDLDTGMILDVVDGRRGATVLKWISQRPRYWRQRVHYVAIDMSTEFRKAVRSALPKAKISVDHFHVVAKTNEMVTNVRRRRSHEKVGRRGRMSEPTYRYRKLLTCNLENLSNKQTERLKDVLAADTELGIIYAIKEHVRDLLKTTNIDDFQRRWAVLERSVKASKLKEARSLFGTLKMWRKELLVFCRTRLTNARSEAANLTAKNMKRIGRGYTNHGNYRLRILLSTQGLRPC